jgi:hypothetical protein
MTAELGPLYLRICTATAAGGCVRSFESRGSPKRERSRRCAAPSPRRKVEPNLDVIGNESRPLERSWDSKDALLYAVRVGAGAVDAVSPDELPYTTENSMNVEQRVRPNFGVIIGGAAVNFEAIGRTDMANLVHGEQAIHLHRPIPVEGTVRNVARVTGIFDKASGMVVTSESTSCWCRLVNCWSPAQAPLFVRGARGWGGERGPSGPKNVPPEREPDHVVTYQTRTDRALTYRLSGDRHALHSDPEFAKNGRVPTTDLARIVHFRLQW